MTATATAVQADTALIRRHLDLLYGHADEDHWLNLYTLPEKRSYWYAPDDLGLAAAYAARLAEQTNVYVPRVLAAGAGGAGERIKGDQAAAMVGLAVDLDVYHPIAHAAPNLPPDTSAALSVLEELPLAPSLVIDSGHGLQAWWLLKEPWTFDTDDERAEAAALSRRWHRLVEQRMAARGWHLDATADLARVVRLAGTINRKDGCEPVMVRLVADTGQRYAVDDFAPYLPWDDAAPPRERAPITEGKPLTAPQRIMVAALLQEAWRPGYRHPLALHVAGWLADHEVPEADAQWIVDTVAHNAGDTARTEVADTYTKARAGEPVAGWSRLTAAADPIITPETAAALDRLMRQREPTLVGVATEAPTTIISGDTSCQDALARLQAENDQLRAENERQRRRGDIYHHAARRRLRLLAQAQRRARVVNALATNPYYDGRVTVARAIACEIGQAGPEDRRSDGMIRLRNWRVAKESGKDEGTVTKTVDSLVAAGLAVKDNPPAPKTERNAPPRTELYINLIGLTLPEDADHEARTLAVEEYLAYRTPVARRTSKKGNTHGGLRPTCGRCGPSAEIEETVTRKWRCTSCDAILESRTHTVSRYRNDGRAPLHVVAGAQPQDADAWVDADPWHEDPAPHPQGADEEPIKETHPQLADARPADPADAARYVEDQVGRSVATPDGLGTIVDHDLSLWYPLGRARFRVRVGDAERWYSANVLTDPPQSRDSYAVAD